MEITYHGNSCVRLRGKAATVVIDPTDSHVKKLMPDIVVRTSGRTDPDLLRPREGGAQEIRGAGEFEVSGVAVRGVSTGERTLMAVEVDDVRVVHLGVLDRTLTEDEIDELGHIDVLVLPVGGGDALAPSAAVRLARSLEPPVVIPVRYAEADPTAGLQPLEPFTKEMGLAEGVASQPKLTLTGTMAGSDETRVVVLEPRS